jgi:hypothetical protein
MPFPFLPAGALIAAAVLVAALTAFGLILRAMDRAIVGLRDNTLSGLVSGLRTWTSGHSDRLASVSPGASTESPWGGLDNRPSPTDSAPPTDRSSLEPAIDEPSRAELLDLGTRPISSGKTDRD